jgi:triosephosphate isomerase (TIM)
MARKTIIAGNWKMNLLPAQAEELTFGLKEQVESKPNLEVVVFPQAPLIPLVVDWIMDSAILVGAQNSSDAISGAFTGETSPQLLKILGCQYCLSGHSERRQIFGESDLVVAKKVKTLLEFGITPVVCVGETLEERESNRYEEIIKKQVMAVFDELENDSWGRLVFAYEPVWAIGTGKTATPEQADEIHKHIRNIIAEKAGEIISNATSILYGGSVKPGNAAEILAKNDIDGLLIGGASLKSDDFSKIISAFN